MRTFPWRLGALLFGSGCCALVYQVAWLREFRLIFGASTAASAAVLAIFIGGLGLGGLLLGTRADGDSRPILLYARLESIVAVSAALSPLLLALVRHLYILAGGTTRMGLAAGTVGRLVLSTLVLAVPTVAMGGTLPAAARGATRRTDLRRQSLATLYALNTLGAVVGCFTATFFLLEMLGNRRTLWTAAALNLLVAILARQVSRESELPAKPADVIATEVKALSMVLPGPSPEVAPALLPAPPAGFILTASATVGFAFFLMELVWYRMLGPLLGGTVFTFGLILAVALTGIGFGGLVYGFTGDKPATLSGFAWSCLLEAAALAFAFALGDRLAVLALVLLPLGHAAFAAQVAGWSAVTAVVMLPAAAVAGYQFPLLIALLGRGRDRIGRQVGLTYATNTIGAIVGSLAGGFGLLPWLSAPGAWRFATGSLIVLGSSAALLAHRASVRSSAAATSRSLEPWALQLVLAALTIAMLTSAGPTAVWRHSGIGAGRAGITSIASANQLKDWMNAERRAVVWDGDGTESSIALSSDATGYALVVNGKTDGSARRDAGTQVMMGLLGPILNPRARRSLVVGLGTGSTAGWLGAVPAMEQVDVVELEPLVLDIARACHAVNRDVMNNPKVHISLGDAREMLLTSRDRYDVIASEPSNPFRAGIASLFTREYYLAATQRLNDDGLFIQWMQAYEIDSPTLRTVYATLASVFPHVETWQTSGGDLILVAGRRAPVYRRDELTRRIAEEPFRSALRDVWRAVGLDGFLAHYVAGDAAARAIASVPGIDLNTDDRSVIEFGLARSLGSSTMQLASELRQLAAELHAARPPLENASFDWARVDTAWISFLTSEGALSGGVAIQPAGEAESARRLALVSYYERGDLDGAARAWQLQSEGPRDPNEVAMVADLDAWAGSDQTEHDAEELARYDRGEAYTVLAAYHRREGGLDEAATDLESAFEQFRESPWATLHFKQEAMDLAGDIGGRSPALARRIFHALDQGFAVRAMEEQRLRTRASLSEVADFTGLCRDAIAALDPYAPWTDAFLTLRRACYAATEDARLEAATRDLIDFRSHAPVPIGAGIVMLRR